MVHCGQIQDTFPEYQPGKCLIMLYKYIGRPCGALYCLYRCILAPEVEKRNNEKEGLIGYELYYYL